MSSPRRSGGELEAIKEPQKVKVLILSESRASLKDFYLIAAFTNLIKIDLSYNKLAAFPPGFSFRAFPHLRTLFLHYNKFAAIKQLLPLTEVPPPPRSRPPCTTSRCSATRSKRPRPATSSSTRSGPSCSWTTSRCGSTSETLISR